MCRYLPFITRGVCIDCGSAHDRTNCAWRCGPCTSAVMRIRNEAKRRLNAEIQAGRMPRARELYCHDCERPALDYDHRDYSQPLKVTPLCRSCNLMRGPAAWQRPQYAA